MRSPACTGSDADNAATQKTDDPKAWSDFMQSSF